MKKDIISTSVSLGLSYKALDLHVHSTASEDYEDKSVSASDIIEAAINAGLDGICITDHNTASGIDELTEAAKGKSIVVFPGVEISVTGGKEGPIHVIGIFNPGTTTENLHDLLPLLGLNAENRGKTASLAEGNPNTVINKISEWGGIPVLAHADSSHGVLHDMKGQPRTVVIKNPRLIAAEVSKNKYRTVLNGSDPQYQRFLPTYESSDAHTLSQIGSKRTYFKVQDLSLESLRQCFLDPIIRIRSEDQYAQSNVKKFPRIISITISKGFFDGESISLHSYQNTLIGGQGVGKSLLIEFVRFALDQISTIEEIKRDTESKLRGQLGVGGEVQVIVELPNGIRYEFKRIYDGNINPLQAVNLNTGVSYEGDIESLFPVMAYSQTEAIYIARNPNAQLELIDRFVNTPSFEHRMNDILAELRQSDQNLAEITDVKERLLVAKRDLNTIKEEIHNIEESLASSILEEMKQVERQKEAFQKELEYHTGLAGIINDISQRIKTNYQPPVLPDDLPSNKHLNEVNQLSVALIVKVLAQLQSAVTEIKKSEEQASELFQKWLPEHEEIRGRFEDFLAKVGGDQQSLEVRRQALESGRQELEEKVQNLQKKVDELSQLLLTRKVLLDQLDEVILELFEARKRKYDELTEASQGKLSLGIVQSANTADFVSALQNIATGTRIRKTDLASIAKTISPRELIDLVWERNVDSIAQKSGLSSDSIEKFVNWLNTLEAQEQVWALQHQYMPQDVPSIRFRKDDGSYYELAELSVGQKCTALLIIALSAGEYPVMIDQPEESIDIASVFSDIVSKLRTGKEQRQFILTTHNPNIAVTADSDLIHILKSTATHGQIVKQGAIEDVDVRQEVIQHLEGGEKPYLLRGQKYGLFRGNIEK